MIDFCRRNWEAGPDVLLFNRLEKSFELWVIVHGKGLVERMGEVQGYGSGHPSAVCGAESSDCIRLGPAIGLVVFVGRHGCLLGFIEGVKMQWILLRPIILASNQSF